MSAIACQQYLGKYRGTVVNNVDPELRGRVQAMVPDVSNVIPTSWATPCLPVGGPQMGFFTVPLIGAGVWIEFEQGDPDYPIWTGCWWGSAAEVPATSKINPPAVPAVTVQTPLQHAINVSDAPGPTGGILLKTPGGATISINDSTGIVISNGRGAVISMNGPNITISGNVAVL